MLSFMNEISILETKFLIDNENVTLDIETNELEITCKNNCEIFFSRHPNNLNLKIIMMDSSKLLINNFFIYKEETHLQINIDQESNSNLEYRLVGVAQNQVTIDLKNNINGNNNQSKIIIRFLSEDDGQMNINVEGQVLPKVTNNVINEEVKILSLNNLDNQINPNVLISSDDTVAIHNATIGGINPLDLFYLESKGLSKKASINLIKNGFLLKGLKLNKKLITKIKKKLLEGSEGNGY